MRQLGKALAWLLGVLVWSAVVRRGESVVSLRWLSTQYLPHYRNGTGLYSPLSDAAVQSAYDRRHATVYTVGASVMHVIDVSVPSRPQVLHYVDLPMELTDVEVCGDTVAVTVDTLPTGLLQLFQLYDRGSKELRHLDTVEVGSAPGMLKFTNDCRTILVANEALINAEASVSVLSLDERGQVLENVELDFTSFNERADEYVRRGVRWPRRTLVNHTFSRSLEPEYITLNEQETKAYVSLQENNAIAVLDLTARVIEDIYPLGYKSWKGLQLDASDMDSGINFGTYDIYSLYQPDYIRYIEVDGTGYLLTANEGDQEDDERRGKLFVQGDHLSDSVSEALRTALEDDSQLGRLEFSTEDGRSPQEPDKYDRLVFFGGRSVSVFRAEDLAVVHDTGDEIERRHAELLPRVFNTDYTGRDDGGVKSPEDLSDSRSDTKGPEPEALEIGEINGKRLLFVANERVSSLMVYSFPEDSWIPNFESLHRGGETNLTYEELYSQRRTGDLDPDDLRFIKGSDTPVGRPLLLVTGKASGTVTLYEVVDSEETTPASVVLKPMSTVYIPYDYDSSGQAQYGIDEGAVEQSAYDPINRIVYNVGDEFMHVVDITDVSNPNIVHYQPLSSVGNDVDLCGKLVGVALDGDPGTVQMYSLYDSASRRLEALATVQVGSRPDMLKFTHDCRTLVVANEGEAVEEDGNIVDKEGSITVISLSSDGALLGSTDLDFRSFNARANEYVERGVRWPYRGDLSPQATNLSQSLEPEYIAFNEDDTKAYICLQENNAIAVVDLTSQTIEEIYPLGVKSWRDSQLDASDKDGGIHFSYYDIYSIYQPDAIKYMEVDGIGYLLTANEGDALSYEVDGRTWEEDQRGKKFVENNQLSNLIAEDLRTALADDSKLGRLQFSTVDGRSAEDLNKFDRLVFFGGRGFSVFRADDMALVYDSADQVELRHAALYPRVFNGDGDSDRPDEETPEDTMDSRSDNKGPECESLETGMLDGTRLLFVGQEKVGSILVYSFAEHSALPTFESLHRAGGIDRTFSQLLDDRNLGDLDPEDLRFIPAEDSPSGRPLLLVTSGKSGTLAIYEVAREPREGNNDIGATASVCSQGFTVMLSGCVFAAVLVQSLF